MREKTIEKVLGKMEEKTMDEVVDYINNKGNDEEFIINIFFGGGGEKNGEGKNREERNRFGIYKACKGQ